MVGKENGLGFSLSLLATTVIGIFGTIGDSAIMGFMKSIPPEFVLGWGSGTGIAGITGSGMYLLFKSLGFDFKTVANVLNTDLTPNTTNSFHLPNSLQVHPLTQSLSRIANQEAS